MADPRDIALVPNKCALLIIDMQNFCAKSTSSLFNNMDTKTIGEKYQYLFSRIDNTVIPSIQALLTGFRAKRPQTDVIFTYIECLTKDGRDQSLDYKLTGFLVPKGSDDAKILSEISPTDDEILIPKTACSVFNSTNIEYVLRNLGVTQVVMCGILTNQCVESAVRDAADRGFLVTVVEDAVASNTQHDHEQSLKNMRGFSRICSHNKVLQELKQFN